MSLLIRGNAAKCWPTHGEIIRLTTRQIPTFAVRQQAGILATPRLLAAGSVSVRFMSHRRPGGHAPNHSLVEDSAPWSSNAQVADALGSDLSFPDGSSPSQGYNHLVAAGKLTRDEHQAGSLASLDALYHELMKKSTAPAAPKSNTSGREEPASSGGIFGALFGAFSSSKAPQAPSPSRFSFGGSSAASKGLYLWGGTGCGKTMLMDVFYRSLPGDRVPKLRVHFHSFMLGVHARLHAIRGTGHRGDPLVGLADEIMRSGGPASESGGAALVMCFDEMQVTDVGDAMIMRRLFEGLWARGIVVVTTSNRPPGDLYANGLQRELFMPFIASLESRTTVLPLASPTDYRMVAGSGVGAGGGGVWLCPETVSSGGRAGTPADAESAFKASWEALVKGCELEAVNLQAQGRAVAVPCAAPSVKAARFHFDDLCSKPLYSADYQVIAQSFSHVHIDGVPRLTLSERNEVRRFITLVDTLYEHRVRVVIRAAAPAPKLFTPVFRPGGSAAPKPVAAVAADGASPAGASPAAEPEVPLPTVATAQDAPVGTSGGNATAAATSGAPAVASKSSSSYDEVFAFDRTVSRLMEMQSEGYRTGEWRPHISG